MAADAGESDFYLSVEDSLQGVIDFAASYSRKVIAAMNLLSHDHPRRADPQAIYWQFHWHSTRRLA